MTETDAKKSQVERFREAAREHQTDDREEAFDIALKEVARSPVKDKAGNEPKDGPVNKGAWNSGRYEIPVSGARRASAEVAG